MEVMGGAPFMDGEWESICKILSFDQDSDIANSVSHSVGMLMGNSNSTSTSQCEMSPPFNYTNQHFLPTPFPHNLSQLSCISDLSNGLKNGSTVNANEVQTSANIDEDDQISSLTSSSSSSLGFLACDAFLMNRLINEPSIGCMKRKHEQLEIQAEIPASKKRSCAIDNRKMRPRKSKNEASQEEEQKWSSDTSENESNGSHEVINEENSKLKGKKRVNKGATTDPQSLYARKRRERINERLRTLQKLVPNGTKVDISTMLEEAVTYIKFLQLQIKLLSSDDMWMYAPLAYNGFDVGHYNNFSLQLPRP